MSTPVTALALPPIQSRVSSHEYPSFFVLRSYRHFGRISNPMAQDLDLAPRSIRIRSLDLDGIRPIGDALLVTSVCCVVRSVIGRCRPQYQRRRWRSKPPGATRTGWRLSPSSANAMACWRSQRPVYRAPSHRGGMVARYAVEAGLRAARSSRETGPGRWCWRAARRQIRKRGRRALSAR